MSDYSRVNRAYQARIRKVVDTIGHADLTAGATSQVITSSKTIPPGASIVGCNLREYTPFSGGGVTDLTVDVGVENDTDCIVDGANLAAAAVDGNVSAAPAGIAPNKYFSAGGALRYRFAAGANVNGTDAGAVTIETLYSVSDEGLDS